MGPVNARSLSRFATRAIIAVVALLVLLPVVWTLLSAFKHTVDIETTPPTLVFKPTLRSEASVAPGARSVTLPLAVASPDSINGAGCD